MNIIVCIKYVPDTMEVRFDPETHTLVRDGVPHIVNPFDENGIETALQLREQHGGKVTVMTMCGPQGEGALRAALAMGDQRRHSYQFRTVNCCDRRACGSNHRCP